MGMHLPPGRWKDWTNYPQVEYLGQSFLKDHIGSSVIEGHHLRRRDFSCSDLRISTCILLLVALYAGSAAPASAQSGEIGTYLADIRELSEQALQSSRQAEAASTVAEVKQHADAVFATVWGTSSGLTAETALGAERVHGWKTRWQVTPADFDTAFAARYESGPPEIDDPSQLGIVGRGRYIRSQIEAGMSDANAAEEVRTHGAHVINSLNNVIGWMKMDDGVTKAERQPRVDLTREWDAPIDFWMSTADTGWLHEVFAQAVNILKTDYDDDLEMAKQHAAGMTSLIEKMLQGVDANDNGSIEPVPMEGGLETALQHAGFAGYIEP